MTDDLPQSSDEMLRRAREGLTRPMESAATPAARDTPKVRRVTPHPPVTSPRLRPPPRPDPVNPAPARLAVAIAVLIALIGAGLAILAATAGSTP